MQRRAVSRALHIALSTRAPAQRTDATIQAEVDFWTERLQSKGADVVKVANQYLNQSLIPYTDQKIVQWCVGEAYKAGRGDKRRAEEAARIDAMNIGNTPNGWNPGHSQP